MLIDTYNQEGKKNGRDDIAGRDFCLNLFYKINDNTD